MDTLRHEDAPVTIQIKTFGNLAICVNGKVVLEDQSRMRKLWNLFGYLIATRTRETTPEAMAEAICGDDRIADPAAVIKNQVYRLRTMLANSDLPKLTYICYSGGVYRWNPDIPCIVDSEEFERLCKKAKAPTTPEDERLELYLRALSLYKERYMPKSAGEFWAITSATYYHNLYLEAILSVFTLYEKRALLPEMIELCEKAIEINGYDESLCRIYIRSLIASGRHQDAMAAYERIVSIMYDNIGFDPSPELQNLFREIIKPLKSPEKDLHTIKTDLNEAGQINAPYCCDYEIFKDVYRFLARGVQRNGQSFYVLLCTMYDAGGTALPVESLSEAMRRIEAVIGSILRRNDLYARYSVAQYVILLSGITSENAQMVASRIRNAYEYHNALKNIKVQIDFQPLDPILTKTPKLRKER